jgi:hypothetical protein
MGRKSSVPFHGDGRQDWNSHQRGGFVTLLLWQGAKLSSKEVARLCVMSRQGAEKMMTILSAALPIVTVDGKWQWIVKDDS